MSRPIPAISNVCKITEIQMKKHILKKKERKFMYIDSILFRYRPRFFDQVGHQITYASMGNKHFITK